MQTSRGEGIDVIEFHSKSIRHVIELHTYISTVRGGEPLCILVMDMIGSSQLGVIVLHV